MIIELTRGSIFVKINGKTVRILGEMFLPEDTRFEFVVYLASIKKWEKPYDDFDITEDEKFEIIEDIKKEIKEIGARVVFE